MTTFSIMCDHCETMIEYTNRHGIVWFINNHQKQCNGPHPPGSSFGEIEYDIKHTLTKEK